MNARSVICPKTYHYSQLKIGPGASMRAFLTHRNAVTTSVKRVAPMTCTTENEKKEVLQADLELNVSLCLHNSFCRNREQKVNVDLQPCCKQSYWNKKIKARPATLLTWYRMRWKTAKWASRNKKRWSKN